MVIGLSWPGWFLSDPLSKLFCSPFKMAAITKNRNFFNCLLLLYYKSQ